jgi:8-oxo-dGTP pyrophosphatase MutT (NUDIX family)
MKDSQLNGVIVHSNSERKTDYLYRVSLKAMIRDENGNVLVVKEKGTSWWDLPGGGMDHDESMRTALAREMKEEVGYEGDFDYRVVAVDENADYVEPANAWQIRLIFEVHTSNMNFTPGDDGEEVLFIDPMSLRESAQDAENRIYAYALVGQ